MVGGSSSKQSSEVRDREHAAVPLGGCGDQATRDRVQCVDVQSGVDLVQHGELGPQDAELHHLGALALATGEVDVDESIEELGPQFDRAGLLRACVDAASSRRRRPPPAGRRVERRESRRAAAATKQQSGARALGRRQSSRVRRRRSAPNPRARDSPDVRSSAWASVDLPEPFGPMMAWTSPDRMIEVETLQDLFAAHCDAQTFDLQRRSSRQHHFQVDRRRSRTS